MTTTSKIGACLGGKYSGDKNEVNRYMHVYRGENGVIKVVTGPNREFGGRPSHLLGSYAVRGNGDLVPVSAWLEQARSAS